MAKAKKTAKKKTPSKKTTSATASTATAAKKKPVGKKKSAKKKTAKKKTKAKAKKKVTKKVTKKTSKKKTASKKSSAKKKTSKKMPTTTMAKKSRPMVTASEWNILGQEGLIKEASKGTLQTHPADTLEYVYGSVLSLYRLLRAMEGKDYAVSAIKAIAANLASDNYVDFLEKNAIEAKDKAGQK